VVLLFTDLKCKPCNELLPLVAEWQSAGAGRVNFAVVSRGSVEDNADKAAKYGVHNYLVQNSVEVIRAYAVTAAPSAVIVRSDGSIGSPVVVGSPQIIELVSTLIGTLEVLDSTKRHPAGVA
jgi:thiol-disulfide isomerase/thioredoxin